MQDTLSTQKEEKIDQLYRDRQKLWESYNKDMKRLEQDHKKHKYIGNDTYREVIRYKTHIYRWKTGIIDKQIEILKGAP